MMLPKSTHTDTMLYLLSASLFQVTSVRLGVPFAVVELLLSLLCRTILMG